MCCSIAATHSYRSHTFCVTPAVDSFDISFLIFSRAPGEAKQEHRWRLPVCWSSSNCADSFYEHNHVSGVATNLVGHWPDNRTGNKHWRRITSCWLFVDELISATTVKRSASSIGLERWSAIRASQQDGWQSSTSVMRLNLFTIHSC